jgi:hypothetical protein
MNEPSAEERAERLVQVVTPRPGGMWSVQLCELLAEPVIVCEHPNPAVVRDEAKRVRAYVTALIREVAGRHSDLRVYRPDSQSLTKGDPHELDDREGPMEGVQRQG